MIDFRALWASVLKTWPQEKNQRFIDRKYMQKASIWCKRHLRQVKRDGALNQTRSSTTAPLSWKIDFRVKPMSEWFGTIPQHENSSRNSILTTRTSRNGPKLRNYEKHNLSDETASPGSWGTSKLKISLLTQQILWIATPGEIPVTRRAYIFKIAMLEE